MPSTDTTPNPGSEMKPARRIKPVVWILIALAMVAVLVLGIGGFFLVKTFLVAPKEFIFLGLPDEDQTDLRLVDLNRLDEVDILLARNIQAADIYFTSGQENLFASLAGVGESYGEFLPDIKGLMYYYLEDEEIVINSLALGEEEPVELFRSKEGFLDGRIFPTGELFTIEPREGNDRCYFSSGELEAERVGKGTCWITQDGKKVFILDESSDEYSLTSVTTEDGVEQELFNNETNLDDLQVSADGLRIAYTQTNDEQLTRIILLDTATNDVIYKSDWLYSLPYMEFAASEGNVLVFIDEAENGILSLNVYGSDGEKKVVEGVAISAILSEDGNYLVYSVEDLDGLSTIESYSLATYSSETIMESENEFLFIVLQDSARILLFEMDETDEEMLISSSELNGTNLIELFTIDDQFENMYRLPGSQSIFFIFQDEDGLQYMQEAALGVEDAEVILEEWYDLIPLNISPDEKSMVFTGQEDEEDDAGLFLLNLVDFSIEELDNDSEEILNAAFTSDGKSVVYTAVTGSDPDEVEVRKISVIEQGRYEIVYERATMLDISWTALDPFLSFLTIGDWALPIESSSLCPGAAELIAGANETGTFGKKDACYVLSLEEGPGYVFSGESSAPFNFTLYDGSGNLVDSSSEGKKPSLSIRSSASSDYFLKVHTDGAGASVTYTISFKEGIGIPAIDNAPQVAFSSTKRGAVTSSDLLPAELDPYSLEYGDVYYFDGMEGDDIQIGVLTWSIGSEIDPFVLLFNSNLDWIDAGYGGGDGYDSLIATTLPADDRYYIVVTAWGGYGSTSDAFYDLRLDH